MISDGFCDERICPNGCGTSVAANLPLGASTDR
jgi:hypothetical protein